MKWLFKTSILVIALVSSGCASTKIKIANSTSHATILENGVKRSISVSTENSDKTNIKTEKLDKQNSQNGLIIKFKDNSKVNLGDFEAKYGLKFKKKLVIGYYIFLNNSANSDLDIVQKIIDNENNIKTVKPNWKMSVVPK